MIPSQNIVAWANVVPWAEPRQTEQDLIISRSLVEMFSDPGLREALRFRGGTALNKLHLPTPLRYSEDIGLVRTSKGPIGNACRHEGVPYDRNVRPASAPVCSPCSMNTCPFTITCSYPRPRCTNRPAPAGKSCLYSGSSIARLSRSMTLMSA